MKSSKLIAIILFFIFTVAANAVTAGFSPSTVKVGERFKIYLNADGDLPSGYDIRISSSSSSSASATKLDGGPKNWYKYTSAKKVGTFTIYFKIFKNSNFYKNITSRDITVKSNVPTISSVSVNPQTGYSGSSRTFKTYLSGNLPSGYYVKIDIGAGYKNMYCNGSTCSYTTDPQTVGSNRRFTVKVVNSSGSQQGSSKSGTYTVEEKPEPQYPPTLSASGNSSVNMNSNYTISLGMEDKNNNLRTIQLNWGDGSRSISQSVTRGSNHTEIFRHTYTKAGTFTITAKVYDHTDKTASISKRVTVKSTIPTIISTTIDKTQGYSGDTFKFTATLSNSLPSGYKVFINFGDSKGWLAQTDDGGHAMMDCIGTNCSLQTAISSTGNRKFRVGIFDSDDKLVGNYFVEKYFTISDKTNPHNPTISLYSGDATSIVENVYTIKFRAKDVDSDLKMIQVNFGDSKSDDNHISRSVNNKSSSIETFTHIYKFTGTYTITSKVYDDGGRYSIIHKIIKIIKTESNNNEVLNLLNKDSLINKMRLQSNLDSPLSRSDAVIVVDRMRALVKSGIDKNMQEYYNPFADVPDNAEYLPSLMRLAYYHSKSFDGNPINKYNNLFNPMRHMSREEFLAVAMTAFDIPKHSYDLSSKFSDANNMSDWAKKYFETAVYYGIIHGNNGKLLARDKISIQEALWILARIKDKFGSNYPFDVNSYDSPDSLDVSKLYHKTIGFEYEPRYYKPDATPINISSISNEKRDENGHEYYILTVNSTIDDTNGASDYYWWSADKGYFKEEPGSSNFKKVRFYPMSTMPESNYHIVVNGGDNLGYVSSATKIIKTSDFRYPESSKVVSGVIANLGSLTTSSNIVANRLFTVDLSNVSIKKTNVELGVDQIVVSMRYAENTYELFHGTPSGKKAIFSIGDYKDLYGKDVTLNIEVYSQDKKYTTSKNFKYIPQFIVKGKVVNAYNGQKITAVVIDGKEIALDENGEFYYIADKTNEIKRLHIRTKENSQENHFVAVNLDLTYNEPNKYLVLTGEDARPSLNLMVLPIHVPSNKSVKFILTSDINIPSDTDIELENSSCSTPVGLGTTKVEITCATASVDEINNILMSIKSDKLYDGEISRTIVVDPALNSEQVIDTVKEELFVPSETAGDIYLPTEILGVNISWVSSDKGVISGSGKVVQQTKNVTVTLTAKLTKNQAVFTKVFNVKVFAKDDSIKDTDGDGISDSDEIHYGLDPNNPNDANEDADGDGVSNIDEIKAGTDIYDITSYPRENKIHINKGWNLVNVSPSLTQFDNKNIKLVWSYKKGKWSAYSNDNYIKQTIEDKNIKQITKLKNYDGIWIKSDKELYLDKSNENISDYNLSKGWNLLGANQDINTSIFDGSCVDFIWKYDNGNWKFHVANGHDYGYTGDTFTSLSKGDGFWVKGSSNCDIDTNSNATQNIKALLVGKTFYTVDEDDNGNKQVSELTFNQDATSIHVISPNKTEDWGISIDGNRLVFSNDTDGSYSLVSQANGYIYFDDRLSDGTKDGDGHRLYGTEAEAQAYFDSSAGVYFTSDMITNKSYYYVFVYDNDPEAYGIIKRSFNNNIMTTSDEYGYKFFDKNITLNNGKISYKSGDHIVKYELVSKEKDYLNIKGTSYNSYNKAISHFSSRLYHDEAKAAQYEKSLETYDNTFFDSSATFTKPEVIEQVNFAKLDDDNIDLKTRFNNYGFTQNSYFIDNTGVTLTAKAVSGKKSQIKGYLVDVPYHYDGIACYVTTANLDTNKKERVKIQMNGYNDGTQDVQVAIQILNNKVVYYQWQSKTADNAQTLANWTTVLDWIDFNNKDVKIAVWVKDAKVHFYAECDGQIGYETFDISGYENNPLENSHWSIYKVEAKDGGATTSAKFTKIDTLR